MTNDLKEQAIALRKQGLTYPEISSSLNGAFSIDMCKKYLRGIKPAPLQNDIREIFREEWYGREYRDMWPLWIDDIVSGVARLDWYGDREQQIPLSTVKIIQCFLWLDEFTVENIMELLSLKKRMSLHYLKACTLCYPHLRRSTQNKDILTMKYRRQSIVSEEHGLKMGYGVNYD